MVTALNGAQTVTPPAVSPFTTAFTAERAHAPVTVLADIKEKNPDGSPAAPYVQLVPHSDSVKAEGLSQRQAMGELSISVMVYGHVGVRTPENVATYEAACSALDLLRDQLQEYFLRRRVNFTGINSTKATLKSTDGEPAFFHKDLVDKQTYVSERVYTFTAVL